jgi:YaaC-like Protein
VSRTVSPPRRFVTTLPSLTGTVRRLPDERGAPPQHGGEPSLSSGGTTDRQIVCGENPGVPGGCCHRVCLMGSDSLYRIRATRASPPGYAFDDEERRHVYGAALAQFDELISAASAVGPASRPLPLFYALSQAGRAISAAHLGEPWRLRWHGLNSHELDLPPTEVMVKRRLPQDEAGTFLDSFSGVAAATGSEAFEKAVTLGELWRSLPEAFGLLPSSDERRPTPLALVSEEIHDPNLPAVMRMQLDPRHVYAVVVGFQGSGEELETHLAKHYPTAAGAVLYRTAGSDRVRADHTGYGSGFLFSWQVDSSDAGGQASALSRVAPVSGTPVPERMFGIRASSPAFEPRWLRPGVGGVALSPLLTWWALLFGLSILARYEPASWVTALDYDASPLAAPLGRLLEIGLERVPELVFAALVGCTVHADG